MEDTAEPGQVQGQDEPRAAPHLAGLHLDGPPLQRLHITLLSRRELQHFKLRLLLEVGQATYRSSQKGNWQYLWKFLRNKI